MVKRITYRTVLVVIVFSLSLNFSRGQSAINLTYQKEIKALSKEDQRVRKRKYYRAKDHLTNLPLRMGGVLKEKSDTTSNRFLKSKRLMEEWWAVDEKNIEELKALIKQKGFPSVERVGERTYQSAIVILAHYDMDRNNTILRPILKKALEAKELHPRDFAWIEDRRCINEGKAPYYYFMPFGIEQLSEEEKAIINQRRKSIGLANLSTIKYKKRGKNLIVKNKKALKKVINKRSHA